MQLVASLKFEPYLMFACWWLPCGVTWDVVPGELWLSKLLHSSSFKTTFSHMLSYTVTVSTTWLRKDTCQVVLTVTVQERQLPSCTNCHCTRKHMTESGFKGGGLQQLQ